MFRYHSEVGHSDCQRFRARPTEAEEMNKLNLQELSEKLSTKRKRSLLAVVMAKFARSAYRSVCRSIAITETGYVATDTRKLIVVGGFGPVTTTERKDVNLAISKSKIYDEPVDLSTVRPLDGKMPYPNISKVIKSMRPICFVDPKHLRDIADAAIANGSGGIGLCLPDEPGPMKTIGFAFEDVELQPKVFVVMMPRAAPYDPTTKGPVECAKVELSGGKYLILGSEE